ncbi:hypothetical protein [Enterobacter cancerogenus]|uniref:hypothetical protein n=1 Tax=Enterobacter cancerogenus TaxID=69218 RepID=UPI0018FED2F5|nr:hypothetical protein [Enterobacter cancerogenus]
MRQVNTIANILYLFSKTHCLFHYIMDSINGLNHQPDLSLDAENKEYRLPAGRTATLFRLIVFGSAR